MAMLLGLIMFVFVDFMLFIVVARTAGIRPDDEEMMKVLGDGWHCR